VLANCVVSVEELDKRAFSVYPNPANERFYIQMNDAKANELRIYDTTGRMVQQTKINTSRIIELNTSEWANGLYQVIILGVGQQSVVINR